MNNILLFSIYIYEFSGYSYNILFEHANHTNAELPYNLASTFEHASIDCAMFLCRVYAIHEMLILIFVRMKLLQINIDADHIILFPHYRIYCI